jgi:hypothetical protein
MASRRLQSASFLKGETAARAEESAASVRLQPMQIRLQVNP